MAAPKNNKNAAGTHRVADINDKKLAAEVRSLALGEIKLILSGEEMDGVQHPYFKDHQFRKQLILKLAGTVLPRLNEHSGEDGGPIQHRVVYLPQRNERMEITPRKTD